MKNTKDVEEVKKDIASRLKLSNKILWGGLSDDEKGAVVDKYYSLSSIEVVGLHKVVEDNRNVRRDFYFLLVGVLVGLLGGLAGEVLLQYLYELNVPGSVFVIAFLGLFIILPRFFEKLSAGDLAENRVLEHLLEELKKSNQ